MPTVHCQEVGYKLNFARRLGDAALIVLSCSMSFSESPGPTAIVKNDRELLSLHVAVRNPGRHPAIFPSMERATLRGVTS